MTGTMSLRRAALFSTLFSILLGFLGFAATPAQAGGTAPPVETVSMDKICQDQYGYSAAAVLAPGDGPTFTPNDYRCVSVKIVGDGLHFKLTTLGDYQGAMSVEDAVPGATADPFGRPLWYQPWSGNFGPNPAPARSVPVDLTAACEKQHPGTSPLAVAPFNSYGVRCLAISWERGQMVWRGDFQNSLDLERYCNDMYGLRAHVVEVNQTASGWYCKPRR